MVTTVVFHISICALMTVVLVLAIYQVVIYHDHAVRWTLSSTRSAE
jgi:hypothetical protein